MATVTIVGTFAVNLGANQDTTISFTLPTGIQDGDLGVFIIGTNSTSDSIGSPPAGWTQQIGPQIAGNADESWLFTRTMAATDSGTTVTISGMTTSGRLQVVGLVARGTLDNTASSADSSQNTSITFSPITPVADDCLVVHLAYNRYASGSLPAVTPPPGFTEFADQASTNTSKPVFASWGGYKQLVGQAGVAQPADTATANTACYGTKYTITIAPPAGGGGTPNSGSATGSVSFSGSASGSAPPNAGGASGSVSFSGSAAGSKSQNGQSAGSATFTGTGTGSKTSNGQATGSGTFTGSATGQQPVTSGSATGSVAFTGSATGVMPLITRGGAATGTVVYTVTATGSKTQNGQATGSVSFTGAGTGQADHSGSTTATVAFTGTAAGSRSSDGAATGTAVFSGNATGSAPVVGAHAGTATGAVTLSGTASGSKPSGGTASGTTSFTGSGSGHMPVVGEKAGAASGTVRYSGTATGTRTATGSATGAFSLTGHGTGSRLASGTAGGTTAFTGSASGQQPPTSGSASGSWTATGSASGSKDQDGQATGSCSFSGSAVGEHIPQGQATGTFTVTGFAAALDSRIDVTVLSIAPEERVTTAVLQFRDTSVLPSERETTVLVEERLTRVVTACRTMGIVPEEAYMKFPVQSRQFYRLTITTDPAVTAPWQASFDGGTTWVAGNDDGSGQWSWLLETGAVLDGGGTAGGTTLTAGAGDVTRPLLRCDNGSELIIQDVPDDCVIEWV